MAGLLAERVGPTTLPPRSETGSVVVAVGMRDPHRSRWIPTLSTAWADPNNVERPVVALHAPPVASRPQEILRHVLFAMGKSPHVTGGTKDSEPISDATLAWFIARRTRELIICDAPQVRGPVLQHVLELAAGCGIRTWLIGHANRTEPLEDVTAAWGGSAWDLEDFDRAWGRPETWEPRHPEWVPPAPVVCELPRSTALTFLADCRRLLSPERHHQILSVYVSRFRHAAAELDARSEAGKLDHDALGNYLRRAVRQTTSSEEMVITVRAIEAAALQRHWVVDVDMPVLLNAAERNPRPGRYSAGHYTALDAYIPTRIPALAALLISEIDPTTMFGLQMGEVTPDGAQVATPAGPVDVSYPLRAYVQAHLLSRRIDGAADTDLLFLNDRGEPARLAWATRMARVIEVETYVRLSRPRLDRKALTTFEWLTAHGINVRSLDGVGTGRRARQ